MLKCAQNNLLNFKDVNTLNSQRVISFLNFNFADTSIIIKKKKLKYLIDYLQPKNFACF